VAVGALIVPEKQVAVIHNVVLSIAHSYGENGAIVLGVEIPLSPDPLPYIAARPVVVGLVQENRHKVATPECEYHGKYLLHPSMFLITVLIVLSVILKFLNDIY
jgi:hypothetical protein